MKISIRQDLYWSFSYFLIIIGFGTFMRLTHAVPDLFSYNYRYVLHTHSHIAILGWIYTTLTALLSYSFIPLEKAKQHRRIFYLTQISLLGMLFSFPFQGYGAISISFSVLFLLFSYYYSYFFLKNSNTQEHKQLISYRFVRMGIFYLILSSVGIWMIPVAIATTGKDSNLYQASIFFFLDFQYNGWVLTTLMGLFLKKNHADRITSPWINKILYGFQIGVFGAIAVSYISIFDSIFLHLIATVSSLVWMLSIGAVIYFYIQKYPFKNVLSNGFLFLFITKVCMMFFASIPYFKEIIFYNNDFIMSYLHFNFLGVINFGLLYLLKENNLLNLSRISILVYIAGFLTTEFLIAYKGICLWLGWAFFENYFLLLSLASGLFLICVSEWLFRINRN